MYPPVGSFLGPCDTRISTRSPSFSSPPSRRRGKDEGAVVGVTWISHAKLRNANRARNDSFHWSCLLDLGSFRPERSLRASVGSVRICHWPRTRRNASERCHVGSYSIYTLSCPFWTPPGVSGRCADWHSHGTISPC